MISLVYLLLIAHAFVAEMPYSSGYLLVAVPLVPITPFYQVITVAEKGFFTKMLPWQQRRAKQVIYTNKYNKFKSPYYNYGMVVRWLLEIVVL
jgi:hypothetical protein